jgi:glycosyltransferase involved in cell wall biosynthesis
MPPDYRFFAQHLEVFEEVRVVARVADAESAGRALRADGPGVRFAAVPCYAGPAQFLRSAAHVAGAIAGAVRGGDALLLRAPSHLANLVAALHSRTRFSVEVLGDPWDLYAPGAVRTALRPAYRRYFSAMLRAQCAKARHSAFVSKALRKRYPSNDAWTLLDLELEAAAFGSPRDLRPHGPFSIVAVGGYDHPVKGHDVLIRSMARLGEGYSLTIVGGGRLRDELDSLARRLGVAVHWAGELPGAESVRRILASADLFALASRSEGKPRAGDSEFG